MSDPRRPDKANPAPIRRSPAIARRRPARTGSAATFWVTFGFSRWPACLPTVTATAATAQSAVVAAQKTSTGCLECAAKPAVAICVRSPHSATNTTMNDIVNALAKPTWPPSLPASGSSSCLRHITIAETRNSTPEPMCTARGGSSEKQAAGDDGHQALDRQRRRRAGQHRQRAVPRRQHQRGQRGLVGQLGDEDDREDREEKLGRCHAATVWGNMPPCAETNGGPLTVVVLAGVLSITLVMRLIGRTPHAHAARPPDARRRPGSSSTRSSLRRR